MKILIITGRTPNGDGTDRVAQMGLPLDNPAPEITAYTITSFIESLFPNIEIDVTAGVKDHDPDKPILITVNTEQLDAALAELDEKLARPKE